MADLPLPPWMDEQRARDVAQLRALGYNQTEIAQQLGINQGTVSRYLRGLHDSAESSGKSAQDFLLGLVLGAAAAGLIMQAKESYQRRKMDDNRFL